MFLGNVNANMIKSWSRC